MTEQWEPIEIWEREAHGYTIKVYSRDPVRVERWPLTIHKRSSESTYEDFVFDATANGYSKAAPAPDWYTPTYDAVREMYFEDSACARLGSVSGFEAEFNRWLADRDRQQRAIGWDEGMLRARDLLVKRGGNYETQIDLYAEDNPHREESASD